MHLTVGTKNQPRKDPGQPIGERSGLVAFCFIVVFPLAVVAEITDLIRFRDGTVARADEVNAAFNSLLRRIEVLEQVAELDGDGFMPREGDARRAVRSAALLARAAGPRTALLPQNCAEQGLNNGCEPARRRSTAASGPTFPALSHGERACT